MAWMVSKKVTSFMKRVMFGFEYGHIAQSGLGTPVCTNIDEFLEKFQTAFDPPSPPFLEKMLRFFPAKFFETEMTPPNWSF